MPSTTDRPRGARLPGKIPMPISSTLRQPAVIESSTACDSAGIELTPEMTPIPARFAAMSKRPIEQTNSRPSARSAYPTLAAMHCSMRPVWDSWNGPAQSMTKSNSSICSRSTWSRSMICTAQFPSSAASPSSGSRRRPPSVSRTPCSREASLARREPNTPLAPTMRIRSGRSVDIIEQDLLMDQDTCKRMDQLETEEKGRSGNLAVGYPGRSGSKDPRQADSAPPELQEIMVADECDAIAQGFRTKGHAKPVAEIFFEARGPGETLGTVNDLREPAGPRVNPSPALAAAPAVLADTDDRAMPWSGIERQRGAEQPARLREQ